MISREKIEELKERLGSTAFDIMAAEIPLESVDPIKLSCKSPFKDEKTPSCFWNKKSNSLHCFSTGASMDYIDYEIRYNNRSFLQAVKTLFDLVGEPYDEKDFVDSVNKDFFKNFKFAREEQETSCENAYGYLERRCISKKTSKSFGIKQNSNGDVAFQFLDLDGKLIQTKYRVAHPAKNGEPKWYWQQNSDNCAMLYGSHKADFSKQLIICEGFCDALAVAESGFTNVVSIPGGANDLKWIDFNFDLLDKCPEIILWFDDDEAGSKSVKDIANRLGIYKTKIVQSDKDVKAKILEYYKSYNSNSTTDKIDANNVLVICGPEEVRKFIANAKELENPRVQRLMDCEEIQLQDMPKISMGFTAMDKVFYGSFENSLTIITGKSGNGKSTVLNTMFVAAPLEAGQKVFIYSGEIPNGILLGNIIKPMASRRHILQFKNEGQPDGYSVSRDAAKEIKSFYRDSLFVYNDDNQFDTNSKSIIESMEYSYRRFGVTNFIIDSLLTVDCSCETGDDKYEKQKNFVIGLKNFTNRNPVRVALVAHSRKLAAGTKEIGGDDIAGSSDIIKCCNRAFSVEILWDDEDGYNTCVKCIKDRETGLLEKEVKLFYDKKSYRVYSDKKELDKAYSWEKKCNVTYGKEYRSRLVENIKDYDATEEVLGVIK